MGQQKVFISYRREDTSGESGRLKDKLEQIFGKENIFYDVETLEAGLNFDQSIAKALNESEVLLAMIGPHWLKVTDAKGTPRIQKSEDWVRKEISEALKRGIRVIPVLVNGADMPDAEELPEELKELALKHAQELSSSRWNYDVGELTKVLERLIPRKADISQKRPEKSNTNALGSSSSLTPKSWLAKNYLYIIGGVMVLFLLKTVFFPGDYDDSYPAPVTEDVSNINQTPNGYETDSQSIFPELSIKWRLTESRNNQDYPSTLQFSQKNGETTFEQSIDGEIIGSGNVQVDGTNLTLIFTYSDYDSTGKFMLETKDQGISWSGKVNYPTIQQTYNAIIIRESNP